MADAVMIAGLIVGLGILVALQGACRARRMPCNRVGVRPVTPLRIVAAAIKHDGTVCFVPRPGRHHHVIGEMARAGIEAPITGEQGFVTSDGQFVDRVTANRIAVEAEQLLVKPSDGLAFETVGRRLYSEDVW